MAWLSEHAVVRAGLELSDLRMAPDADQAAVVWADILSDRILVVTDVIV